MVLTLTLILTLTPTLTLTLIQTPLKELKKEGEQFIAAGGKEGFLAALGNGFGSKKIKFNEAMITKYSGIISLPLLSFSLSLFPSPISHSLSLI